MNHIDPYIDWEGCLLGRLCKLSHLPLRRGGRNVGTIMYNGSSLVILSDMMH